MSETNEEWERVLEALVVLREAYLNADDYDHEVDLLMEAYDEWLDQKGKSNDHWLN